jgi:hypothetical protein
MSTVVLLGGAARIAGYARHDDRARVGRRGRFGR